MASSLVGLGCRQRAVYDGGISLGRVEGRWEGGTASWLADPIYTFT